MTGHGVETGAGIRQGRERSPAWKLAFGVALSAALLGWILYKADLREVADALGKVSCRAVLASVLIGWLSIPLRTVQWRWLLGGPHDLGFRPTLRATCLGYVGNCLLPMRGGEVLKAYLLARWASIPFPRVFASVVLARIQDFAPILALLAVTLMVIPAETGLRHAGGRLGGARVFVSGSDLRAAFRLLALFIFALAAMLVTARRHFPVIRQFLVKGLGFVSLRLAHRAESVLTQLGKAAEVLGSKRYFWGAQGLAFICWGLFVCAQVPLLMAFSVEFERAWVAAVIVTGVTTVAHLLPSVPGALGTFHGFCIVALRLSNPEMDLDTAVAYAVAAHLVGTVGLALPGLVLAPGSWKYIAAARKGGRDA